MVFIKRKQTCIKGADCQYRGKKKNRERLEDCLLETKI